MATDANITASSRIGGQAKQPGPRTLGFIAAVLAAAVVLVIVLTTSSSGGTSSAPPFHLAQTKVYGHVPKSIKIPYANQVPLSTATYAKPVLNQQGGYPVVAQLPNGASAHVMMAGALLQRNLANNVATHKVSLNANVLGMFEVQFSDVKGQIPLSPAQFDVLNWKGQIVTPKLVTANGAPLPKYLPTHGTLKLKAFAMIPEGDGTIRWAPNDSKVLVGFFWTTEFD